MDSNDEDIILAKPKGATKEVGSKDAEEDATIAKANGEAGVEDKAADADAAEEDDDEEVEE